MEAVCLNVACGLVYRDGAFLAALRGPGRALAGHWEFPGGKLEHGESAEKALRRELLEELDIAPLIGKELPPVEFRAPSGNIRLLPFLCLLDPQTAPTAHEHSALQWVNPDSARKLLWAPADRPLLDQLDSLAEFAANWERQLHSENPRT